MTGGLKNNSKNGLKDENYRTWNNEKTNSS